MIVTFKHFANFGDLIATLCSLRQYHLDTGNKVHLYQQLNVEAEYYNGAVHPTKDGNGVQVMMNEKMFEFIKPLILSQYYIESFEVYNGQSVIVDIDKIRGKIFCNMPYGAIQSWISLVFSDLSCDISKQWIFVDKKLHYKDKIIINFTERYRNSSINYYFLKEHQKNIFFVGTENEHQIFCSKWNLNIDRLLVDDALELAEIIAGCKFFMGNQSANWNIANALMKPRILELCQFAPNCIPFIGVDNFGFYHQEALEYYFKRLNK